MSESKQSFVKKAFLTIENCCYEMLQNVCTSETYLQLHYACKQHSVCHTWVSLGSTGRSTGVRRRQEDIAESVTWNKETLIGY